MRCKPGRQVTTVWPQIIQIVALTAVAVAAVHYSGIKSPYSWILHLGMLLLGAYAVLRIPFPG